MFASDYGYCRSLPAPGTVKDAGNRKKSHTLVRQSGVYNTLGSWLTGFSPN